MKKETFKRILSSIIIIPVALFFIIKGSVYFVFFLIPFFLITSYEWFKMSTSNIYRYLGIIFLFFSSYSAYLMRGTYNFELTIFLFVILICVTTDIGGYIFGNLFKGPKLTKISPNKTYAGMLGGYFLAIIFSTFYVKQYSSDWLVDDMNTIITIFLISSVSQAGDLTISYFKRLKKIKNTGNILPGHGGLLDRVDGIVFAVPFSYIFFNLM